MSKMKKYSKFLFGAYLVILVWILLFKMSGNFQQMAFLLQHPSRSINLIPFGESMIINGKIRYTEIFYNFLIFVPFGGLLCIVIKQTSFLQKISGMMLFSIAVEVLQFAFGLGASDITDVINNTLGGLAGVLIYAGLKKIFHNERKLDSSLTLIGSTLFGGVLVFVLYILAFNS